MEESDSHSDVIPEAGHQRPTLKFLNRYVRSSVGLKWHDLGIELLDSDKNVEELDTIEAEHPTDLKRCCTKMFQLWLRKQPSATWNQLIKALRQRNIELDALATNIEELLLQPKPPEQQRQHTVEPQSSLISVSNLNTDFTGLLLNVCRILDNSPNQQDNLKLCKDYCSLLRVSDSSNDLLFIAENITKIKECSDFKQLFEIVSLHMRWDEHCILTQIVNQCKSDKGQKEIEKFKKKVALYQALQIISSISKQNLSEEFAKFCVIIDKPYENVTVEEYEKVKAYIFSNLNTCTYVAVGYIKMLYHSLHIEWLVTVQAVPHMIKSAHQNKNIFIKRNFVFMQIGSEVVINDEGALAKILSSKQLKELSTKQRANVTESNEKAVDEELLVMKQIKLLDVSDTKITPAAVADEFSYVTEQITELLQSHDPKVIVEQCERIMASDHDRGIKFFSDDQIERLKYYNATPLLLQELSHLYSWSNHSILRVLVGFCKEAIKLLDEFDCHLDTLQPMTSYPVLEIIPIDVTSQTTLNVKFARSVANITLQDVFDICSLVVNHCGVTQYCLQLIATQQGQDFVTIYWSIPKCIVNLISSTVLQHSSKLYDMGVLEVAIYPDIKITAGNIANPKEEANEISDSVKQLKHINRKYNAVLEENRKLREDQSVLLTSLKGREERVRELEEKFLTDGIDAKETNKSSESLLNQKVVQQESEILMLEAKLDEYKKDFEQLSSIHRKCSSQKEKISVGIQVSGWSLTSKLFDILDEKPNVEVTVNDELLEWLYDDSEEYQNLIKSRNDPIGRKENLKNLVFKLYKERKLKDIVFFKYLAWSGQGHLCKLIGYKDKQLDKLMEEKKEKHSTNEPMEMDTADKDIVGAGGDIVYTDFPLHHSAKVKQPSSDNASLKISSDAARTLIIYSEEDSEDVLELAYFLNSCGILCDIDQYHSHENILDWNLWHQQKITECAKNGGFMLLICSAGMHECLRKSDHCLRIKMKFGHIDSLWLDSLITDESTTKCIIPVCLENLQVENIPICLADRLCYPISISKLKQYTDPNYVLNLSEFESLRRLVYRLSKQPEGGKPPVAS